MNTKTIRSLTLIAVAMIAFSSELKALPRTGRLVEGVLKNVDHARHSAEILHKEEAKLITWGKRTKAFRLGKEVETTSIRNGERVRVWRHVPVFGPPFVRQIVVVDGGKP